ncbi:aminopeptidase A-like [Tubulanus polymorphus]|uniref:aminopeptidase A-like n=1 Tax=Tubulanus polymorphus TaxID=672921 RepID=UPI003DA4B69C
MEIKKGVFCTRLKLVLYTLFWIVVVIIVGVATYYGKYCPDASGGDAIPGAQPWLNLRLNQKFVPIHYNLTLYPDIYDGAAHFYGNVCIDIEIGEETRHILVHALNLTISSTNVRLKATTQTTAADGSDERKRRATENGLAIQRTFYYEPNQFWVIEMKHTIKKGSIVGVDLQFDGSLDNGIVGFYKSTYVNTKTNKTSSLATSKFEPVEARKAFPCLDEPNLKAKFTVTLIHRPSFIALSNMPISSNFTRESDNLTVTSFEESVKMSTYLVCFIVCDFEYKQMTTADNKPFRVYATPDKIDQVDYGLKLGVHVHNLYERLYDQPYPLPKQDMIAIPNFGAGAMEHWGLITYRESALLYDPNEASSFNKLRVASVIAHELAHQWFGNIVTMDWWDDLWLNEGFASFMEYKGVESYHPDWDMKDQFLIRDMQRVLNTDARVSSHPIVVPVSHPNEISEVFDSISYSKGASVIRMLESVMGKDKFMTGIQAYLKKFAYKNAKTDDLWEELNKQRYGVTPAVKPFMDTWTRQMGYPVIQFNFVGKDIVLTQKRFISDPKANMTGQTSPFNYKWWVPISYVTSSGDTGFYWMKPNEDLKIVSPISDPKTEWIKFNVDQTGFYRVNYPTNTWKIFANLLKTTPTALNVSDRSSLLHDAFKLASSGLLDYGLALDLVQYLEKEDHYVPWETADNLFNGITNLLEQSPIYGKWQKLIGSLSKPTAEKLGWESKPGEIDIDKQLRYVILRQTCEAGDRSCLQNATSLLNNWMTSGTPIDPQIRSFVYGFGVKGGGQAEWDFMWQKYRTTASPQEKNRLMSAMGYSTEVWILNRYLDRAMDPDLVMDQDFFSVVTYVARNPVGLEVAWSWVQKHWDKFVKRFGTSRYLGRMVPRLVTGFSTEYKLEEAKLFFEQHPEAGGLSRDKALARIRANIDWRQTHEKTITDWLNVRYPGTKKF